MSDDFWIGFFTGGVVFGVAGWFLWTMQKYRRPADAFEKPQMVMHPTGKSPAQVLAEARDAKTRMGCLSIILLLYFIGVATALSESVREVVFYILSTGLDLIQ
jgi:hypothetical protein